MRSLRTLLVLVPALVLPLLAVACDKKGDAPPATAASTSASVSTVASAPSASANGSASASAAGACATLAKEKADRCNKMSGGDPTILSGCREAIDNLVKAADDAKCLKAMTPQTEAPSDDPDEN